MLTSARSFSLQSSPWFRSSAVPIPCRSSRSFLPVFELFIVLVAGLLIRQCTRGSIAAIAGMYCLGAAALQPAVTETPMPLSDNGKTRRVFPHFAYRPGIQSGIWNRFALSTARPGLLGRLAKNPKLEFSRRRHLLPGVAGRYLAILTDRRLHGCGRCPALANLGYRCFGRNVLRLGPFLNAFRFPHRSGGIAPGPPDRCRAVSVWRCRTVGNPSCRSPRPHRAGHTAARLCRRFHPLVPSPTQSPPITSSTIRPPPKPN